MVNTNAPPLSIKKSVWTISWWRVSRTNDTQYNYPSGVLSQSLHFTYSIQQIFILSPAQTWAYFNAFIFSLGSLQKTYLPILHQSDQLQVSLSVWFLSCWFPVLGMRQLVSLLDMGTLVYNRVHHCTLQKKHIDFHLITSLPLSHLLIEDTV